VPDLCALAAVEASAEVRAALIRLADRYAMIPRGAIESCPCGSKLPRLGKAHTNAWSLLIDRRALGHVGFRRPPLALGLRGALAAQSCQLPPCVVPVRLANVVRDRPIQVVTLRIWQPPDPG
jgi:hypothetical protein